MSETLGPRANHARLWRLLAVAAPVAFALFVSSASAASPFFKGFNEPLYLATDGAQRDAIFDESTRANASIARLNISWRNVTNGVPANPVNPADPAYEFTDIDEAVQESSARGLRVLVTVYDAPDFAEGADRPSDAPNGTWKPDPAALGQFAQAVGTRYSGSFTPGILGTPLPAVQYLEAWNESNLSDYITPQSVKGKLFAADHYRKMLNAFTSGIESSGNTISKVLYGGLAPYGDPIGGRRTRPLEFLRESLCLKDSLKPDGCSGEAKFDILAHHPITLSGGPDRSAIHPDDAAMPDFKNVIRTLRAAEQGNTVAGGKHPAWATEIWWETKPPDNRFGVPLNKHARWVQEAQFTLWSQGAQAVIWLQVVDTPIEADGVGGFQAGLVAADGTEKPAFTAFRFPFVVERTSKKKINVWTIPPASGTLEIQVERNGDFKTVDRMDVVDGNVDQKKIRASGKTKLRGVIAGEASLASSVK